ncbi:MAG: RNA 3'-terminal phosphate cyclase [Candidatus Helarchaeota archaeon]|nr:RNA 3'-terminal phosphate cyclase [Candidatus Helarchaeota archaeon]
MNSDFVKIDGSFGEGGGSILRLSCALSVLTKKPVRIFNIRKNRPKQGLRAQHLAGLQALAEISNGTLENGKIGATEIFFIPGNVSGGSYKIRIGTAGSIGLILQILQLACIRVTGPIEVQIEGGATFGLWAPTLPFLEHVLIPQLKSIGYEIEVKVLKHGFYPKGGARVSFQINPVARLQPIKLENFGEISEIGGISIASFHLKNRDVAKRQLKAAKNVIRKKLGINLWIDEEYVEALNPGSGICLWLKTNSGVILGSDIIGERGKPSEKIGSECARYLCEIVQAKATVDKFFSDQIIPFMALASGMSVIKPNELTNHTKTNIWLIEKFLEKEFDVRSIDSLYEITIKNK